MPSEGGGGRLIGYGHLKEAGAYLTCEVYLGAYSRRALIRIITVINNENLINFVSVTIVLAIVQQKSRLLIGLNRILRF